MIVENKNSSLFFLIFVVFKPFYTCCVLKLNVYIVHVASELILHINVFIHVNSEQEKKSSWHTLYIVHVHLYILYMGPGSFIIMIFFYYYFLLW